MAVTIHPYDGHILRQAEVEPWRAVPVAVAVDLVPDEQLDIKIRPLNQPGRQKKLFGRAVTALPEPPDFGAVLHALEWVGEDDVLVIAAGGSKEAAMIGEILSGYLRSRGCAGVVCDGAVRDVATLSGWADFSVFACCVNPRGPTGAECGAVNAPARIGDRLVKPGDLIIGDDDGLVALSPASVRERIGDAEARNVLEAGWVDGLVGGQSVAEVFGLSPGRAVNSDNNI